MGVEAKKGEFFIQNRTTLDHLVVTAHIFRGKKSESALNLSGMRHAFRNLNARAVISIKHRGGRKVGKLFQLSIAVAKK